MLVYSTKLCKLLPLLLSLYLALPPPLNCVNKYTGTIYTYTVCKGGGGYGVIEGEGASDR
jgi:hypothetical protein